MNALRYVPKTAILVGWDFSTGGVKGLVFDLAGNTLADVRLPTDLWTEGGVNELNLMQLEGQVHATVRAITGKLRDLGRLTDWLAAGISATHHTAGRLDAAHNQVRRAICWNDHSLAAYHQRGLARLGGQAGVRQRIGGPWAIRYSLSHLVKDETTLAEADWQRTHRILSHGSLAAGYLTGNFDVSSISSAASSGILDLRSGQWRRDMLDALERSDYRELAWQQLPRLVEYTEPVGPLAPWLCREVGIDEARAPLIFPTNDDQQAGLVGGGAVEPGHLAVILGNSAVVNSSSATLPTTDDLDAMKLNWGPYLWMRCYNNGALFLDRVVGPNPDWARLEAEALLIPPRCEGLNVLPFIQPEPALGVSAPRFAWTPREDASPGRRFRAALEALAYLIALGVRQHEQAGQRISQVSVSGGIARSDLMCEILASTLGRTLERLVSDEGPALGAAATALAALETHYRRTQGEMEPFTVADAVRTMVRFKSPVHPNPAWREAYAAGLSDFEASLRA
jgi:sugar (pentulose or hexulose) kinase